MGRRSFQVATWTTGAGTADATNLTDAQHMSIGATAGPPITGLSVWEIYVGGQATTTAIQIMQFARNSTLGATLSLGSGATDGPLRSLGPSTLTGAVVYNTSTTKPQRTNSASRGRLNLTHNAFGGIVRWFANPGEEWGISGTTVSDSESSLSNYTGSTTSSVGSHIIYEVI